MPDHDHTVKIKTDDFDLSELGDSVQPNQTIRFKLKDGNRTASATVKVPSGLFTEDGDIAVSSSPWPVRTMHSNASGRYTITANKSDEKDPITGTINVGSGDDDDHGGGHGNDNGHGHR